MNGLSCCIASNYCMAAVINADADTTAIADDIVNNADGITVEILYSIVDVVDYVVCNHTISDKIKTDAVIVDVLYIIAGNADIVTFFDMDAIVADVAYIIAGNINIVTSFDMDAIIFD